MIELSFHKDGAIAQFTLARPPANAWTPGMLAQMREYVGQLNANARVRAIVVTGQGAKFFSAGADLNQFAEGSKESALIAASAFGTAMEALSKARPVVIAAINGFAMGGGLECALSCDIRIAETHAKMALPELKVGLLPAGCGTQTLPWLVGEGWAKRMILTGETVDAATALRIGLVEEVVESGKSLEFALEMAERVLKTSPQANVFSKQLIHQARNGVPRTAALAVERERFVDLFSGPDQVEGVNAFLEKRDPAWKFEW